LHFLLADEQYNFHKNTPAETNRLFKTPIKGVSMESIYKAGNYKTTILFREVINIPRA